MLHMLMTSCRMLLDEELTLLYALLFRSAVCLTFYTDTGTLECECLNTSGTTVWLP